MEIRELSAIERIGATSAGQFMIWEQRFVLCDPENTRTTKNTVE